MTYQPEEHTTTTPSPTRSTRNNAPNNAAHDSRFDCNICLEPVTEPVVSRCGHLYCWPCLYRWLQPAMTDEERYDMGWGSSDAGNGTYFGSANVSGGRGSSARRCCPVCKTECSVRDVVPIYVRESDGNTCNGAAVGSSDDVVGIDDSASASATHQHYPVDTAPGAATMTDPTTSTGLRRRRGGGIATAASGGEASAIAEALAENDERNDDDDLSSISTISTDDHLNSATNATNATARNSANATTNRAEATSNAEIPSRPTPQPYLHQRSAGEDSTGMRPSDPTEAPRTPLINNRQQRDASAAGGDIRRPPISPPRGARPSSLSNGLSLTVWSGFVDALLGAQTNAGAGNNGNSAAGADGGYVPPIHRPDNGRGPGRGAAAVSGNISGGGTGHHRNDDGVFNGSSRTAAEATSRGRRWFNPTSFVDDSTTEFLSRLLLMLGCFVVFCLLLF